MSEPYWVPLGAKVPIDYVGGWVNNIEYKPGDVVIHNGVQYIAVNPSIGSTPPAISTLTTPVPVISIGTSFPVSPLDGEEYVLVNSITAPTYSWRFRYTASITDGYKWIFVGGAPLRAFGGSMQLATTQTTPIDVTNGPVVTVPRAGIYRYIYGCHSGNAGSTYAVYMSQIQIYNGASPIGNQLGKQYHGVVWDGAMMAMESEVTLVAGAVLNFKAWMDRTGNINNVSSCWIHLIPVRVS